MQKVVWTPRARGLLHRCEMGLHRCKRGFGWRKRLLGDLRSLGPKESKRPFAPSPNHFWRDSLCGQFPRFTASQSYGSFKMLIHSGQPQNTNWPSPKSRVSLNPFLGNLLFAPWTSRGFRHLRGFRDFLLIQHSNLFFVAICRSCDSCRFRESHGVAKHRFGNPHVMCCFPHLPVVNLFLRF